MADNSERVLRMHVTCGTSKKVLACTKTSFKQRVKELFQLDDDNYLIQSWDDEFADWIDIEESMLSSQEKWKLQIVTHQVAGPVTSTVATSTPGQTTNVTPASEHSNTTVDPPVTDLSMPRAPPLLYMLPRFPEYVQTALERRDPQCRQDHFRKTVIRVLFDDLLQYGLYPGERLYNDACRELVRKYEFLRDTFTVNGSNYHSWVKRLTDKFKKYRYRHGDKDSVLTSEMAKMRQKYGRKRSSAQSTAAKDSNDPQPLLKIRRTVEVEEPPEDELSVDAHLKALQRECLKTTPSSTIIAEKMVRTVSHRAELVQRERIVTVLEVYPCLRLCDEVLAEGERSFKISAMSLTSFLSKNVRNVEKAAKGKSAKALQEIYKARERTEETDITYAAMLLSSCLSDDPMVSPSGTRPSLYPYVSHDEDASVFDSATTLHVNADGIEITQCHSVVTALTVAFVLYWILNIRYPKPFYGTLSLLDTRVFKKNSVRPPQKVISFINKLT